MAFATLEDFSGKGECIVFSDSYKVYQNLLQPESLVLVVGKAEHNGDVLRLIVNEVYPIEAVREKFTKKVTVSLQGEVTEGTIQELRKVAERHQGKYPCIFEVTLAHGKRPVRLQSTKFAVGATDEFFGDVEKILGPHSVSISM